jgi:hypothetical protein
VKLARFDGWEERLAAVVELARHRPYALGESDCFRLACDSVQALTGADLWSHWAGRYHTRREALRLIAHYVDADKPGRSAAALFTAAASKMFGCEPSPSLTARRGDVLEYHDGVEPHLGVFLGARVAVMREQGLAFVPLAACKHAWRIG